MKIAFLCSGGGGNLRFVDHAISQGWLPGASLVGAWCDRSCGAHDLALALGISSRVVDASPSGQPHLLSQLEQAAPDVIVTTINRVLIPAVVESFSGRLVNLHYALLPAYAGSVGVQPVAQALSAGVKVLGITVHHVTETVDAGRPIIQAFIRTPAAPLLDAVMQVLFRAGCISLLNALEMMGAGRLGATGAADGAASNLRNAAGLGGSQVCFHPPVKIPPALLREEGWNFLQNRPHDRIPIT